MLKTRICATVVCLDGVAVQTRSFGFFQKIGQPSLSVHYLDRWGADEIFVIDITPRSGSASPDFELLRMCAPQTLSPLAFGGGITTVDHAIRAISSGADKVVINSALLDHHNLVSDISNQLGSQSVVVSVDAIEGNSGFEAYGWRNRRPSGIPVVDLIKKCEDLGAGEILLNSVAKDGSLEGFDLDLVADVVKSTTLPIVVSGGAGCPSDVLELVDRFNVSGVAIGNRLNHLEHSVAIFKSALASRAHVRNEALSSYNSHNLTDQGRLLPLDEDMLGELVYERVVKEVI